MKFSELKNSLKNSRETRVFLVFGEDAFLRDSAVALIKKAFAQSFPELNTSCLGIGESSVSAVFDSCFELPFMDEYRIVTAEEFYPSSDNGTAEKFEKMLSDIPESTVLVFCNSKKSDLNKSSRLTSVDCGFETSDVVAKWIASFFKADGFSISHSNALLLADYCSCDMSRVNNEIKKLKSYCAENVVTLADIGSVVTKTVEFDVFEMTNAISAKNPKKLLEITDNLISNNDNSFILLLLATLYGHFRRIFATKNAKESDRILAEYLGVKEYAVKLARKQSVFFSEQFILSVMLGCHKADYEIKSGKASAEASFRNLVLNCLAGL